MAQHRMVPVLVVASICDDVTEWSDIMNKMEMVVLRRITVMPSMQTDERQLTVHCVTSYSLFHSRPRPLSFLIYYPYPTLVQYLMKPILEIMKDALT